MLNEPPSSNAIKKYFNPLAGLQGKLIVPYVLLTLLLAMVGIFVVTRLVTSSIRERFVNQLFEASRVASDGIVRLERAHLETLRLMAFTVGVPEAAARGDAGALQELLAPLAQNHGQELVSVIGLDGREVLTLVQQPGAAGLLVSQGGDFSRLDLVAQTLSGKPDAQGDKFAALAETSSGPALITSAPLRQEDGQLAGVLLIGTSLNTIANDIRTQALADLVLLDPDGSLLATTLAEPDEGYALLEIAPSDGQAQAQTRNLRLYGRDFQIVYNPLIIRQQPRGWLGVVMPSSYIVTTEATSRDLFSLLFTLGTAAIILVGYLLSRSIARPILHLRSLSKAVASGDLDQSSGLRRSDEIGELAEAFDQMTGHLRERTAEAARLYAETLQRNRELADINERLKATQAQLIQSEKLAAIGQLTAGIVHDVKNPLAVIMGMTEFLLGEENLDPTAQHGLRVMNESATKANRIVSDLLKFARQSAPEMSTGDLRETIEASLRMCDYLTRKAHVQVVKDLPPEPVQVTYDPQQIEQVLINLIHNAVQAMPDGGTLRVNLAADQGAAALAVQDTGSGIAAEHLGRIFDPFFTTKPEGEGTGLGLSLSHGIIAVHRGRIEVQSALGQGTTFTILLPMQQPETGEASG